MLGYLQIACNQLEAGRRGYELGNYPEAIAQLEKCYPVFEKAYEKDKKYLTEAILSAYFLGYIYINQKQYNHACDYLAYIYTHLPETDETSIDYIFIVRAIRGLGYCYKERQSFNLAIKLLEQGVRGFNNLSIQDKSHYSSLGWSTLQLT